MELPRRTRGDELLKPGELVDIRKRLRNIAGKHDLATVVVCAFDHRTRMLPFIYADTHMVPAGVRAIGAAMVEAGFNKTRIVLQQWNRNFRPSRMRLDGRIPDMFMVSSMGLHSAQAKALIRDACKIDQAHRPLIIAGGANAIYQPWDAFSADPEDPWAADVAVTGEEYVLLNLLEVLLSTRGQDEGMRAAFMRARDSGLLDEIPGLVYARPGAGGVAQELIDTGIQRLVDDLDELPHPAAGFRLLEPPSRKAELASHALPNERVRKYSPIGALVLTFGCKFRCPYCPIPAYNQRQRRFKSGGRIADEMYRLYDQFGIRYFFGTDDNFFNDKARALDIADTLARAQFNGFKLRRKARWYTEVTVHDTLQMIDHLPVMHDAGIRALWIGVEDMTATLVRKGQTVDNTIEVFRRLRTAGICPMPMMMHYDSQPLYTPNSPRGLLNQVRMLRKAGAVSLQTLMITPSAGSKLYEETFTSGLAYQSVGRKPVEAHMLDGNYVIASAVKHPWRKQLNLMVTYLYFYNGLQLLIELLRPKGRVDLKPAGMQIIGILGLVQTIRRTFGWALRLMFCRIKRQKEVPVSPIPMQSPDGGPACHDLVKTPPSSNRGNR